MRVCMLASSYPRFPGDGAGIFVSSLARGVAALGHTVQVVAPADPLAVDGPDGPVSVARFPYSPLSSLQPMGYGKALEDDRRLRFSAWACALPYLLSAMHMVMKQERDVLHVHWLLPNGPVGALARKPFVLTLHGSDVFLAERSRLLRPLARWSLRQAAAVTGCSPEMPCTQVIPWGADPERFRCGNAARWRQRLGIPPNRQVVLGLGRLVEKKGFSYLVQAFTGVSGAVLVIGGDGPQLGWLTAQAAHLGISDRVRFCGPVPWPEVPDLLALADVLAIPSVRDRSGNQDGLPTVALEAMAAGKPVVASRLGGLPMVVEDGKTGTLAPPGDPKALGKSLNGLLGAPEVARAMGRAGRERVEQELNWTNVARRYVEVYEKALATGNGAQNDICGALRGHHTTAYRLPGARG